MSPGSGAKDSEDEPVPQALEVAKGSEKSEVVSVDEEEGEEEEEEGGEQVVEKTADDPMEEDSVNPATVFCIRLKQPRSNLQHKMSVPELCRNFSAVAWCGKLNAIACASETCARIPSSNANPPFWIPIHIVIPERPTECSVFSVIAGIELYLALEKVWTWSLVCWKVSTCAHDDSHLITTERNNNL